jgi:uncharacterized phage protein (TIGR02216 family)
MALGLGILRLEPRAFWTMTPAEFAAAARAVVGPAAGLAAHPRRRDLTALMSRFPDQPSQVPS